MKSDDIDDILSDIDEYGDAAEDLKDLYKDKNKSLSSPVEHLKAKLENKVDGDDLSFLYDINTNSDSIELKDTGMEEISEDSQEQEDRKTERVSNPIKNKKSAKKFIPAVLKIKGTKTWNTREPYTVSLNTEALKNDYKDLYQSFYYIKSDIKESEIIGEMKRSMFKFMRGSLQNILADYSDFLYKSISDVAGKLTNDFGFNEKELPFFIYHLGVITLHMIVVNHLKETGTGYCFRLSSGSKVLRFIPSEFVKEMTIKWHNDNIFNAELPFDGIIEFNELKRQVSSMYMEEVEKNSDKIESMIGKADINSVSRAERDDIFKTKWPELFDQEKIIIYNRFLERTIFKGNA